MRNTRRLLLSIALVIAMVLTLGSLALAADGEAPSVENIESIQAYTDETMYGTGVVKVEVTYKEGVDLSGITAESYVLTDRGTMTPDFGEVKIASAEVDGRVVTLIISGESAATEANGLVYTGDEALRDGPRQRNAFGIYCTNPWYRDVEGKIHFGTEETDEYVPNETNQGYQARACLELKLRHADEAEDAALALADELGQYTDANKWLPTIDQQFGEGKFLNLYDLEIPSTSAAAPDGSGDDFVQGYYFVPENYDPAAGIVFTIQGQGISYWKLPDGTNNAGCGFMYDSATYSWADNGAIVVNIHDRSSSAAKFGEYDEAGYDYVIDDVTVMKYFIEKYDITGPIVIQGNSRGTMASTTIIKALAGRPYGINGNNQNLGQLDKEAFPFMIDTYICQNGGFNGSMDDYVAVAGLGMKIWAFDGEQDSNCINAIANYKEACRIVGHSEEWIEENVRLTGYTSNIYYPWGESDHSTTRMNGWYFDDAAYYGPDLYIDENGEIVYNTKLADGDKYTLEARGSAATNNKNGYEYEVYDDLFQEWALVREEEELNPTVSSKSIKSIQAYTDETIYGTGLVKVEITYYNGVDLSGITADSYILEDRGTMTPDFGQIKIASASVRNQVVTLIVSGESAATEANGLVYTGDEAQRDGPRQRNAFGVYCTNPWYRDVEGKIHFGSEETDEYVPNETNQGYQARACLELKLRHADEDAEAALCLADELGQYTDANKWLPTIDQQFGEGKFLNLYDLEIPSTSAAAPDGSGDDFVQGYYYVPADYNPANGAVFTIQGQGISYWKLPDGTNNAGCGIMYDSATTSWADNGAIVVNIHDRSSSAAKFGEYDEAGYDYVIDDVTVMKYFIEKYGVTGPIVIQGNSRGTMASSTIIKALAGRPYGINGSNDNLGTLDKEEFPFMIDTYICQNGGFRGDQEDYEAIAATGMKVWCFDGEQDSNCIESVAAYKEACRTVGLSEEWIEENVRLTGYTSNIYYPWGESDHSTTRMNGWYFDDAAYYGPDLYINEQGGIVYNTKLADGDTYVLEGRGSAATNSKNGYEYKVYDDLFQVWALTDTESELELSAITEPGYFGQKLYTLIIKYPVEIDGSKLSPEDFEIRALDNNLTGTHVVSKIDRIYTNSEPAQLAEGSVNGQYVIIETNPFDKAGVVASAYYFRNAAGNTDNITIMKNVAGRYFIDVLQAGDIEAADGTVIPAATARVMLPQENVQNKVLDEFQYVFVNDEEANEILSEFTFGNNNSPYSLSSNTRTYDHTKLTETEVLGDLNEATLAGLGVRIWYQLPENYDPNGKYPLFLYAHGSGECFNTKTTWDGIQLTNDGVHFNFGMPTGAWALTEEHGLDDCIVVAPQYYSGNSPRADGYERDDAFRVALCYALKNFAVDRDRVFVSGTSQGAGRTTALVRDCSEYITAAIVQNGAYSSALSRAKDVDPIEQHRMIFQYATDNDVMFWFFQGVNDPVSPKLTSETMYQALVENYKAAGKSDEWIDENVRYTYLNNKLFLDMNESSFHSTMKPTYLWYAYYNDELFHATYSDAEDSLGEYFDTRYGANDPGGFSGMIEWALTRTKG